MTAAAAGPAVDADQIGRFMRGMFRYAEGTGTVAVRAFLDDAEAKRNGAPPFALISIDLNGAGLDPVIDAVVKLAQRAAAAARPVVVCPPVATFMGRRATEADVKEGLGLAVECDRDAHRALRTLRAALGAPTFVVASGGEWTDPATGEVHPRLHVHWRLKEPTTTPTEHAKLKRARKLASELVDADASAVPLVHPLRWPGTLHRKAEPKLARILEANDEAEIDLDHALAELEGLLALRARHSEDKTARPNVDGVLDAELLAEAGRLIGNADLPWDEWNRIGMAFWRASAGSEAGFDAFDAVSRKSSKYDQTATRARWDHYQCSPPDRLGAGTIIFLARLADGSFARRSREAEREAEEEAGAGSDAEAPDDWRAALAAGIEEVNSDHFVTRIGSPAVVVRVVENDDAFKRTRHLVVKPTDVRLYYANRPVKVGETARGDTYRGLGSAWLDHRSRRTYERMVLMPNGDVPAGVYNMWRGFGLEPRVGEWPTIRAHLEQIICAGDTANLHYLERWMAHCVQHPEQRAEVAVVLRGIEGTGKGLVGRILKRFFRDHSVHVSNPRHLTGNFNAHLMDALYVYADEVFCVGDRTHEAVLKTLITEETIPIEPKGVDLFEVPTRIKLLISSNKEWVIPVSAQARRFFMLDVSEAKVGDLAYFEQLAAAIDGTELPAFLAHLLSLDLTGWKIRAVPHTKALNAQKLLGADITTKFVHACLIDGCIGGTIGRWPVELEKKNLRHYLWEFAQMHGERSVPYEGVLTKKLQDLAGLKPFKRRVTTAEKAQNPNDDDWFRGYQLLPLAQARAVFLRAMKIDPDQYDWGDLDPNVLGAAG